MKKVLIIIVFLSSQITYAQNCEAFKYYGDTLQYEACQIAEGAKEYYQFSREFQEIYDEAIRKCPYFASAYHSKSVAYLKSGDFINWKKLIDKAVELKPKDYLGYRGWCRFEFFRDYKGAIKDIEALDSLVNYDIGYSSDGAYHLEIARAICYKELGQKKKAIDIIQSKLKDDKYQEGLYDYFHLGVLYLEEKEYEKSIDALNKQNEHNNNAENHYYQALAYKHLAKKEEYMNKLHKAKELYLKGIKMQGGYSTYVDKVYLSEIEDELNDGLQSSK